MPVAARLKFVTLLFPSLEAMLTMDLSSSSEHTDDTDVMTDEADTSFDGLPMPFPYPSSPSSFSSFDFPTPVLPAQSPYFNTPVVPSPGKSPFPSSPFPTNQPTPQFSPFQGTPTFASPLPVFPTPLPRPFSPTTPENRHVRMVVPTPDFSILKKSGLSQRKLTRTASRNILPETPMKVKAHPSRLGGMHTPVRSSLPALHTSDHFSHSLTPRVDRKSVV